MKINEVETVTDHARGCGWRKEGGLYLRCEGEWHACGKLPVPLHTCPTCGHGVKPARGWSWVDPRPILAVKPCTHQDKDDSPCDLCPMAHPPDRAGLLWVGEKFYPTPESYLSEARRLGVSRRIPRVPYGFKLGDRVLLAHRLCIPQPFDATLCDCPDRTMEADPAKHKKGCASFPWLPGIFTSFCPERIEYVCKGTETEEELDALTKRGITPVIVQHATENGNGKNDAEELPAEEVPD